MKELSLISILLFTAFSVHAAGGAIIEPVSQLVFDYDNVSDDVAQKELNDCVSLAEQASQTATINKKGSGAKGAAKGAAAGALIGSISGNSGSDAAKTGAAIGVVGGRLESRKSSKQSENQQMESFKTVLRNCMTEKQYVALN
ncbi:glycine zipper domain-containing protein [Vibrio rotiferianus]|uniref:glycine zipper domain-containing protein n=1 Tax=Vibrio rotiferianus TaxID=190895 RepID=UPI000B5A0CC2|nr:glycine zipper domain-containing protein [Vibrio rotiferianus]ASI96587.1 hypothetical protein BSZ04_16690 [Vibrio rotiferianus]